MSILRRDMPATELRADESGRRVFGVVVPYRQVATVSDGGREYPEMFVRGAFERSISQRAHKIKLMASHDRRRFPIGRAVSFAEADDGLHGEFAVPRTAEGDDVLTLVRDGVLDSFSVGFRPIRDRIENGVTVRTEASLSEVSLVACPRTPAPKCTVSAAATTLHFQGCAEAELTLLTLGNFHELHNDSIRDYTSEQARRAAQQLLDETDGDLVGEQAEAFRALVDHAKTRQDEEALGSTTSSPGTGRVPASSGVTASDRVDYVAAPVPAATQERDSAMRMLDRSVKDGTLAAGGAETAEQLLQTGPSASRSWRSKVDDRRRGPGVSAGVRTGDRQPRARAPRVDSRGRRSVSCGEGRAGGEGDEHHRLGGRLSDPLPARSQHHLDRRRLDQSAAADGACRADPPATSGTASAPMAWTRTGTPRPPKFPTTRRRWLSPPSRCTAAPRLCRSASRSKATVLGSSPRSAGCWPTLSNS